MSKMLRNTRDAFLKPNAVMKAVLGAVGVLPTELQRGAIGGSFRQPLLAGHAARVVSRALPNTVWWHSDLLGACAGTGAPRFETDAKSPQRVVIDATNVPSIDAFSALVLTQIQPLAKALPANSRVVVLHVFQHVLKLSQEEDLLGGRALRPVPQQAPDDVPSEGVVLGDVQRHAVRQLGVVRRYGLGGVEGQQEPRQHDPVLVLDGGGETVDDTGKDL